jgi:5-methylcytosine-specific restriction endonuclease McrA
MAGNYIRTPEHKEKMKQALTGKKQSPETIEKRALKLRGQKRSPEVIEKMKMARAKQVWSKETLEKKSRSMKGKWSKETHPNWKGGRSFDRNNYRQSDRKRRAQKRLAVGERTNGEWELLKKQYGFICPSCGKSEPEIKLTADHIIPLSKGGSDYIENIQPLCVSCNSRKHTKIITFIPFNKTEVTGE